MRQFDNPHEAEYTARRERKQLIETVVQGLDNGKTPREVTAALVSAGYDPSETAEFVDAIVAERRQQRRQSAIGNIVAGVALTAAGIGIPLTMAQFFSFVVVTYGLAIWGVIKIGAGLLALGQVSVGADDGRQPPGGGANPRDAA